MNSNLQNNHIAEIINGLFVGSWLSTKEKTIKEFEINSVISIGSDADTFVKGVEYSVVHLDDNIQSVSHLQNVVLPHILPYIHERMLSGKKVLVHCSAGKSRSVTIVAAYLIKHKGFSANDALTLLQLKRPVVCPNEGFKCFLQQLTQSKM
jgi:protein-tyrosine phosphatase